MLLQILDLLHFSLVLSLASFFDCRFNIIRSFDLRLSSVDLVPNLLDLRLNKRLVWWKKTQQTFNHSKTSALSFSRGSIFSSADSP